MLARRKVGLNVLPEVLGIMERSLRLLKSGG